MEKKKTNNPEDVKLVWAMSYIYKHTQKKDYINIKITKPNDSKSIKSKIIFKDFLFSSRMSLITSSGLSWRANTLTSFCAHHIIHPQTLLKVKWHGKKSKFSQQASILCWNTTPQKETCREWIGQQDT
jgi:hypothetical protein